MKALREVHDVDPRDAIWATCEPYVNDVEVLGASVLVAIYRRPEKTAGGIIRPDAVREEDIFQGKVGLILKMGPLAFREDADHQWGGITPKVKDWAVFRVGDGWPLFVGEVACRVTTDVSIRFTVRRPDMVY